MSESDPGLNRVTLDMCDACLDGTGGICQTPGCVFWMSRTPDLAIRNLPFVLSCWRLCDEEVGTTSTEDGEPTERPGDEAPGLGIVGAWTWKGRTWRRWVRATKKPEGGESQASAGDVLGVCRRIVAAQAEDGALWSPSSVVEAYVVQELRTLHRAVEGDLTAVAAIED